MRSFYLTDAGKVRDHNEDSVIIVKNDEDSYLMAIAVTHILSKLLENYLTELTVNNFLAEKAVV